jgi:hemerythrin-like domain-containing protein
MDAITLLTQDHREVEQLFQRFDQAQGEQRREVAGTIIRELAIHSEIEKLHLYPTLRESLGEEGQKLSEHSLEEHQQIEEILAELDHSLGDAATQPFAARMQAVLRDVKQHVEEEENEIFPKLRRALDLARLNEIGDRMAEAKAKVPTHPHPSAPNQGMAHEVMGRAAGIIDRVRDRIAGRA